MLSQTNFWLNRPNSESGGRSLYHIFQSFVSAFNIMGVTQRPDSAARLSGPTQRSDSAAWLSSPTQRPDSAAWQLTGKDHSCADRESNPGQMLGRHLCYHYTIGAVEGQGLNLVPHASTVNRTRGLKIFSLALSQLSYRSWSNCTHSTTYNVIQIGNNHLISPKRKKTWNFFMGFCTLFWYSQF